MADTVAGQGLGTLALLDMKSAPQGTKINLCSVSDHGAALGWLIISGQQWFCGSVELIYDDMMSGDLHDNKWATACNMHLQP